MANSRYKSVKIEYFEDRKLYGLMFQERKLTDAKWLTREELIKLDGDINNILGITKVTKYE